MSSLGQKGLQQLKVKFAFYLIYHLSNVPRRMQCQFYRHFIALFWEFHLNIFRLHFPGSHNWAFSFSSALLSFWRPCGTEKITQDYDGRTVCRRGRKYIDTSFYLPDVGWPQCPDAFSMLSTCQQCFILDDNMDCGNWCVSGLVCCRCSSSTASAMLPTSSTASASRNLDPPKQNHPPSESSSLWHILGGAEHFNQIFKRMFGNILDIFVEKSRSADIIHPS